MHPHLPVESEDLALVVAAPSGPNRAVVFDEACRGVAGPFQFERQVERQRLLTSREGKDLRRRFRALLMHVSLGLLVRSLTKEDLPPPARPPQENMLGTRFRSSKFRQPFVCITFVSFRYKWVEIAGKSLQVG